MKVVITGGTGFLGLRLAQALLVRGSLTAPSGQRQPIDEMVLFDVQVPENKPAGLDQRVRIVAGEVSDQAAVARLIDRPDIGIFHLASVVSAGAEQDFDLAMKVNLHGHIAVLDAARRVGSRPRYVFASSLAAYGGKMTSEGVSDTSKETPQTTYGTTKVLGEILVHEYSRKGFIDGRGVRLPAVIVRPGKPNKAASSFVSAVIREPLNGVDYTLPVPRSAAVPVAGYRTVIDGLIALYELDGAALGDDRSINLPNLSVTVDDMIKSLERVAAGRTLGAITVKVDPFVTAIIGGWPARQDAARALSFGLPKDESLDAIIRAYIADYLS